MKPTYVPLLLEILVCIEPDHYQSKVAHEVYEELSNKRLRNGRRGFFHPDNFSVGTTVYLPKIIGRVLSINGVKSLKVKTFTRLSGSETDLVPKKISVSRDEIARLDNDPISPENGVLIVEAHGGK